MELTAFEITVAMATPIPANSAIIIELFAPTVTTAIVFSAPVKFPTTTISEALKSYSKIAVAATGSANSGSLFHKELCNISSDLRFCFSSFFSILLSMFYR